MNLSGVPGGGGHISAELVAAALRHLSQFIYSYALAKYAGHIGRGEAFGEFVTLMRIEVHRQAFEKNWIARKSSIVLLDRLADMISVEVVRPALCRHCAGAGRHNNGKTCRKCKGSGKAKPRTSPQFAELLNVSPPTWRNVWGPRHDGLIREFNDIDDLIERTLRAQLFAGR